MTESGGPYLCFRSIHWESFELDDKLCTSEYILNQTPLECEITNTNINPNPQNSKALAMHTYIAQ